MIQLGNFLVWIARTLCCLLFISLFIVVYLQWKKRQSLAFLLKEGKMTRPRIISLYVDDSPESREAERLLIDKGIDIETVKASPEDLNELTHPRLITDQGTWIGLPHIRLFLRDRNTAEDSED